MSFPVAAGNNFHLPQQIVHDVNPGNGLAGVVKQPGAAKLPVVESGITFQPIEPNPHRDFHQLSVDLRGSSGLIGRKTITGIVQRSRNSARADADDVPAETMIPLSGHQRSVGDVLNCVCFF